MSVHLDLSLILDGLKLWAQTHTHTHQLNHAGLSKSMYIKLPPITLTYSYQTTAPISGILEFSQYCNNTLCAKGTRNSSGKSHRDLGTCLLSSPADGKV